MGGVVASTMRVLVGNTDVRILMNGLDAAGKTSILYRLKLDQVVVTIPTIGFNVETVSYKNINFTVWDLGGRDKIRSLWRHYYQNTQGLIWVIDSTDLERLEDVREELVRWTDKEHELANCVMMILCNKQDLPNAMDSEEIVHKLDLHNLFRERVWNIFEVNTVDKTSEGGLTKSLEWFSHALATNEVKEATGGWWPFSSTPEAPVGFRKQPLRPIQQAAEDGTALKEEGKDERPALIEKLTLEGTPSLSSTAPKDVSTNRYGRLHQQIENSRKLDSLMLKKYGTNAALMKAFVEGDPALYPLWSHRTFLRVVFLTLRTAEETGQRRGKLVTQFLDHFKSFCDGAALFEKKRLEKKKKKEQKQKEEEAKGGNEVPLWVRLREVVQVPIVYHLTIAYFWVQMVDFSLKDPWLLTAGGRVRSGSGSGETEEIPSSDIPETTILPFDHADSASTASPTLIPLEDSVESEEIEHKGMDTLDFETLVDHKEHKYLLDHQLFTQYYSRRLIFHTPSSMVEFALPDKKPLPSILSYTS